MEMFSASMDYFSLTDLNTFYTAMQTTPEDVVLYLIYLYTSCQIKAQHKKKQKTPRKGGLKKREKKGM